MAFGSGGPAPRFAFRSLALRAFVVVAAVFAGGLAPSAYPVFDLATFGAVGDGVTNNDAAFSAVFSAAAKGGMIRVPCGVFKIAATPSLQIPPGQNLSLVGSGSDCTTISVSGPVDGPTFAYGDQFSSVRIADITFTTDQPGGYTAVTLNSRTDNQMAAFSSQTTFENVVFRGADAYGANAQFWGEGVHERNVSNISIVNPMFDGPHASPNGVFLVLQGLAAKSAYSVQISISHMNISYCKIAIAYEDWVQGLAISNSNVTGCDVGVQVVANPKGTLDQIAVVNSQFNTFVCSVCVNDGKFNNLMLSNNMFITNGGSKAVVVGGTNWLIEGNEFGAVSPNGTTAITVRSTFGNGGLVMNNHFEEYAEGIAVGDASQSPVKIANNLFVKDKADYAIASSAVGVLISDTQPRAFAALPPCRSATKFAEFEVMDSPTATFHANVDGGGGREIVDVRCDGEKWQVR